MSSDEAATAHGVRSCGDVRESQLLRACVDSPWVHDVDLACFHANVDGPRTLGAPSIISSHLTRPDADLDSTLLPAPTA